MSKNENTSRTQQTNRPAGETWMEQIFYRTIVRRERSNTEMGQSKRVSRSQKRLFEV